MMDSKQVNPLLVDWHHRIAQGWGWLHKAFFVVFFILSLAFFLHFRDVRVENLESGSMARNYVLAQVSFDFADVESTRIFKEESLRDISPIYYFSDEEILKAEQKVQAELLQDPSWRERFLTVTFDELMDISDKIRDLLIRAEFANARTIQKLEQVGFNSSTYLECSSIDSNGDLMATIWAQVKKTVLKEPEAVFDFILDKYQSYPWTIKEDFSLRKNLRTIIKKNFPIKIAHIEAGSRIINAGDRVTERHIKMLKAMKKVMREEKELFKPVTILGSIALSTILILLGLFYFQKFYPSIVKSFSKMALIATVTLLTLCLSKSVDYYMLNKAGHLSEFFRLPIFLLFASLTLSILIDRNIAMIVSGFIALVLGISLGMESYQFLTINLSVALMAIIWTKEVRKRKEIFGICSKIWLLTLPMILALNLLNNQFLDRQVLADAVTTFISIFGAAIFVVISLPLLESGFGVVTDMALLEAADPNHPLLRRLSLESAGTYQHSLSVASLAEEAALAIGANALQCRVSALYHDIGKVSQPHYFTENQFSGFNMHQLLTPFESAQVIIQHVTEGIRLAESYELPAPIIDVIREHHGTTLVYYFYHAQIEQNSAHKVGVEEAFFRYPGPTPQTRESAVVMIADSIEAAYRCQEHLDEKGTLDLIERIVADKIREHQLDNSHLTFDDLEAIKKAVFRSLMAASHGRRITYPPRNLSPTSICDEALI